MDKNPESQAKKQNPMQRIKAAIHVYTKSLFSVKYYRDLIKTDLKFSLKYYAVLATLFTLVHATFSTTKLAPKIQKGVEDAVEYVLSLYEDDLEISIKSGRVSINKKEPYVIPLNLELGEGVAKNIIVFDSNGGIDDIKSKYDTLILVNKVNLLTRDTSGKIEVVPLSNIPDTVITKQSFSSLLQRIQGLTKFVPYIVGIVLTFSILMYYLVFRLIYLLLVGILLLVVGEIRGLNLTFSKYYKVALHTMSLPLTLGLLESVVSAKVYFPGWFIFLNLIFGALIVFSLDQGISEESVGNEENGESGETELGGGGIENDGIEGNRR